MELTEFMMKVVVEVINIILEEILSPYVGAIGGVFQLRLNHLHRRQLRLKLSRKFFQ